MNAAVKGSCLVGVGIFVVVVVACWAQPAHATEGPLLVVVEAPPTLDVDAAEIRRAIGNELRSPTIAPTKTTATPAGRALIVALERERIVISFRTGESAPVTRVIPAPAEPAARLRAIAWLAGNLVRDQVTPIVADALLDMPSLATIPPATPVTPDTEPPPLAAATLATISPGSLSDVPTISTPAGDKRSFATHLWTVGAADGPTSNFPLCNQPSGGWPKPCAPLGEHGNAWRVEVQRRSRSRGFFSGVALEGTAGSFSPQLIATSAFLGSSKAHGKWTFESTVGAGLELSYVYAGASVLTATHSSSDGFISNITSSDSLRPALFADGALAVSHPVSESLGAVLRVGAHISTEDFSAWFLSVTFGLRYNLL